MLVDARHLTNLQKRQGLIRGTITERGHSQLSRKDAGLLTGKMRRCAHRRNPDIDMGVEIPFHPQAGADGLPLHQGRGPAR